jgi:hypothetical protein
MKRQALAATVALGLARAMLSGGPVSADLMSPTTAESHPDSSPASLGLRGSMVGGNTVGDQIREAKPRADGYRHIDTPRLIRRLKELNVNFYVFQIRSSPTEWEDLRDEFASAAQQAGIKVMPYLVSPTNACMSARTASPSLVS